MMNDEADPVATAMVTDILDVVSLALPWERFYVKRISNCFLKASLLVVLGCD